MQKDSFSVLAADRIQRLPAVSAQLAVSELRQEGKEDAVFIAVRLPHGTQQDEDDAQLALSFIQPDKSWKYDIAPAVTAFSEQYQRKQAVRCLILIKGTSKHA